MQNKFSIPLIALAIVIALSGCGGLTPTPLAIVVTATPPPTLTPLPVLPSATPVSVAVPTLVTLPPIVPLTPTLPKLVVSPASPTAPNPPATPVLPQLTVNDPNGHDMEMTVLGGQVGKTLVFRVIACAPDCKKWPDGSGIDTVQFTVFKVGASKAVYEHTENTAPYCSFSDYPVGAQIICNTINLAEPNPKWYQTNTVIDNGDYYLKVNANGKNAHLDGRVNFKIQR